MITWENPAVPRTLKACSGVVEARESVPIHAGKAFYKRTRDSYRVGTPRRLAKGHLLLWPTLEQGLPRNAHVSRTARRDSAAIRIEAPRKTPSLARNCPSRESAG